MSTSPLTVPPLDATTVRHIRGLLEKSSFPTEPDATFRRRRRGITIQDLPGGEVRQYASASTVLPLASASVGHSLRSRAMSPLALFRPGHGVEATSRRRGRGGVGRRSNPRCRVSWGNVPAGVA